MFALLGVSSRFKEKWTNKGTSEIGCCDQSEDNAYFPMGLAIKLLVTYCFFPKAINYGLKWEESN